MAWETGLGAQRARRGTHGTAAIRPRGGPTTRPMLGHDTAPLRSTIRLNARNLGAPCAQPGSDGCEPCALDLVFTQCTVFSHCLGTLFMNTIHEHCS